MQTVLDILGAPLWGGVGILLSIIFFVLSLEPSQGFFRARSWKVMARPPWTLLFVAFGVSGGVIWGLASGHLSVGLLIAVGVLGLGTALEWIRDSALAARLSGLLLAKNAEYDRLLRAMRRIGQQEAADLAIRKWKLAYSIDEAGNDSLQEEMVISSLDNPIHIYSKTYSISKDVADDPTSLAVERDADRTRLDVFEVEHSDSQVKYLIHLDPPATKSKAETIIICCKRRGGWTDLIKNGKDDGSVWPYNHADLIEIEFFAPKGTKWQSVVLTPAVGEHKTDWDAASGTSHMIWSIEDAQPRPYHYTLFLQKVAGPKETRP